MADIIKFPCKQNEIEKFIEEFQENVDVILLMKDELQEKFGDDYKEFVTKLTYFLRKKTEAWKANILLTNAKRKLEEMIIKKFDLEE